MQADGKVIGDPATAELTKVRIVWVVVVVVVVIPVLHTVICPPPLNILDPPLLLEDLF